MLVEVKTCTFTLESRHFIVNKCPNYATVQVQNLLLSNTKQITVYTRVSSLISFLGSFLWLPSSSTPSSGNPPSSFGNNLVITTFHHVLSPCSSPGHRYIIHNLIFLSVYSPLSTIRSHGGLKGLSHEMNLAWLLMTFMVSFRPNPSRETVPLNISLSPIEIPLSSDLVFIYFVKMKCV